MLVGSKAHSKSLNVDDFILKYEVTLLELVENAQYLGMSINSGISMCNAFVKISIFICLY